MTEYDYLFKILIIGDEGVGKSSLTRRFADDMFDLTYIPTIGVEFKIKTITLDQKQVKLQIWDLDCTKKFESLRNSYFDGTYGAITIYDVTDERSFDNVTKWMSDIDTYGNRQKQKLLVGNKNDLIERKVVDYATGKSYADNLKIPFIETSAKDSTNVELAFIMMASQIKNHLETEIAPDAFPKKVLGDSVDFGKRTDSKSKCY